MGQIIRSPLSSLCVISTRERRYISGGTWPAAEKESSKMVRRATGQLQERLRNLCIAREEDRKSVSDRPTLSTLHGLGHAFRFFH